MSSQFNSHWSTLLFLQDSDYVTRFQTATLPIPVALSDEYLGMCTVSEHEISLQSHLTANDITASYNFT